MASKQKYSLHEIWDPNRNCIILNLEKGEWVLDADFSGAEEKKPFWPHVNDRSFSFSTDGKLSFLFEVKDANVAVVIELAPWPTSPDMQASVYLSKLTKLAKIRHQLKALWRLFKAPHVREKLFEMFSKRGQGFLSLLRSFCLILYRSGLAGVQQRISKPFVADVKSGLIPDYWWYQKYRCTVPSAPTAPLKGYVVLKGEHTRLLPGALALVQKAIDASASDLFYGDDFVLHAEQEGELRFRAQFSLDRFLFRPELGEMVVVKEEIASRLGLSEQSALTTSTLIDVILNCRTVTHVSAILSESDRSSVDLKEATRYIQEKKLPATIYAEENGGNVVEWAYDKSDKVAFVIPTKNGFDVLKKCIDSIRGTCRDLSYELIILDHESDEPETLRYLEELKGKATIVPVRGKFNFAAFNNAGVQHVADDCRYLVLLNNDIEVITPAGIERMLGQASRPDVGIVGPLLQYPDQTVQHAGVVLGLWSLCEHVNKFLPVYHGDGTRQTGRDYSLVNCTEMMALTGACYVMRREVFAEVCGFDEGFAVGYNDIDLCLRVRQRGYKILFNGSVVMTHHESVSRGKSLGDPHPKDTRRFRKRYEDVLAQESPDPFFSPFLSRQHLQMVPDRDKAMVPCQPMYHSTDLPKN